MKRTKRSMEVLPSSRDVEDGANTSSELELNDLPEEILPLIASKLPLRDAARTSILSRVWKESWTCHPELTFNFASMLSQCSPQASREAHSRLADKFICNVNGVLEKHIGIGVRKLEVKFYLYRKHAEHLDRWISFALASKAELLILVLQRTSNWCEWPYRFACSVVNEQNSSCIKLLRLCNLSLKPPPNFRGFFNLKVLVLEEVDDLENLQYLLSGSHVLEVMIIIRCHDLINLRIFHPLSRLSHLCVEDCGRLNKIEFAAANLVYFEYSGPIIPIVLGASSSLSKARISDSGEGDKSALQHLLTDIPSAFPHLKSLTLRYIFHPEPAGFTLITGKFVHLRCLKLVMYIFAEPQDADVILRLAYVFAAARFLATFMFHVRYYRPPSCREVVKRGNLPTRPHYCLKRVKFTGFSGFRGQVELARYILDVGRALERMIIDPRDRMIIDPRDQKGRDAETAAARELAYNYLPQEDSLKVLTIL